MKIRDFRADATTGDFAIVNGDLATVADAAAVPQGIRFRVLLQRGEYWLDESQGVPWLDEILGKNRDPLVVRGLIGSAIGATPDVVQVQGTALELDAARVASIAYQVATTYSDAPINGEITGP